MRCRLIGEGYSFFRFLFYFGGSSRLQIDFLRISNKAVILIFNVVKFSTTGDFRQVDVPVGSQVVVDSK